MSLLNYRIIQFFQNPMREEGRNIGIVAYDGQHAWFRSLGMTEGLEKPDLSRFKSIAGGFKSDLWVFGEWIQWFNDMCRESEGNAETIDRELDELANQSPQFGATSGGYYELGDQRPETAVQELFTEIVGGSKRQEKQKFKDVVDEMLIRSEIPFRPGFEEGVEVTITATEDEQPVRFILDYYLENETRVGFKLIQFKGARAKSLSERVNDAIYAFGEARKHGFLDKKKCVVLCDSPSKEKMAYVDSLESVATVVDVTKRSAHRKILNICSGA